ncbi:MAG: hypothetical protein ACMUHU_00770 [Thermoplasmatota archaeon]
MMGRKLPKVLLVSGCVSFLAAIMVILVPVLLSDLEGSIEVNWANPVGIQMKGLQKGDSFEVEYSSDINVSLYLLTDDQANEYRSPALYKDPLPDPLVTDREGSVTVHIEEDGDYEILFLPEEPARTFTVDYKVDRSLVMERSAFLISSIGLFLTSIIFLVLGVVLLKRTSNDGQM